MSIHLYDFVAEDKFIILDQWYCIIIYHRRSINQKLSYSICHEQLTLNKPEGSLSICHEPLTLNKPTGSLSICHEDLTVNKPKASLSFSHEQLTLSKPMGSLSICHEHLLFCKINYIMLIFLLPFYTVHFIHGQK